ncbi:hypothetical protein IQ249_09265 [Lusitaniella coriacea LEGE 07157]|uniref:Uncharacterized protein n=1 Tax=Lusitaniella coriacea LEGE 07157 TaxID=945747 RepID=A0A8J7DW21_9CYAN|nr:hypothetical protein [Lusitaniella coriacea]MBE9116082.1 hypothetical protein [Lusitaniella coriacea LEGE 07157]
MSSYFDELSRNLGETAIYYPKLAKIAGGVTAAIFWIHLCQRQEETAGGNDWLTLMPKEIEAETGLCLPEQELARQQLRNRGWIRERSREAALEFSLDRDRFQKSWDAFTRLVFSPNQTHPNPTVTSSPSEKSVRPESLNNSRDRENIGSDPFFPIQRQQKTTSVTPHYQFQGPWDSPEQFQQFQKALLDYAANQGFSNPGGWVFRIIDSITKGIISPYWDEFISGVPLGETQKVQQEWEVEPGVPYPAFEEERIQYYIHKGEPLEVAVAKARSELRNPTRGKDLWDGFLRKCDRVADEALRAKKLGVKSPYLPPSFSEKPPVTKASVIEKLSAVVPPKALESTPSEGEKENRKNGEIEAAIPSLEVLQKLYNSPLGKRLVERQIEEHPEWGYSIVRDRVIDLYPF